MDSNRLRQLILETISEAFVSDNSYPNGPTIWKTLREKGIEVAPEELVSMLNLLEREGEIGRAGHYFRLKASRDTERGSTCPKCGGHVINLGRMNVYTPHGNVSADVFMCETCVHEVPYPEEGCTWPLEFAFINGKVVYLRPSASEFA
ncbi:hypothetical protein A3K34_00700 [candidate division WWE3 bacterium RIFOXYC1_FULL_40_10]|nr:MAG: hypothetical protein A3K58_00700 [candidate division WWE3 bacterium RIFOXYB1_FULL_40_22]OGC61399.1 MAG: hypothetical protein A3K37_00700 [candidate division WWE3 bacterium RIFOXYA1_FULL_40_11]OGC65389.1 MAG: hypothetical protein A2326_04985 [candidate division WWE3 bacterium RIFOXYB2_FULL_41_6]OGC65782.1 MAG: hypothetical protein A3K34_00700 [candidate division WWE3 bacterium RIFOXYC1_FULL_40_10]OGC67321.1 MAG: hypothetical protein A2450_00375 [candidate division WWE3 bacterium RIFOXYC2